MIFGREKEGLTDAANPGWTVLVLTTPLKEEAKKEDQQPLDKQTELYIFRIFTIQAIIHC